MKPLILRISGLLCSVAWVVCSSLPTFARTYTCGYQSCPVGVPGMLNVHLVPHTHDDVGWLKTVDQYYYGAHSEIQRAGVQYILDSVVKELLLDPKKKFIYVETAFFWRWWQQQDDVVRHQVKKLVNSGQLEFIGGGWCMNDEATTHYNAIIDQMTWGFRRLNDTFGECGRPRVSWQIDPFGHSREQASLFAQMGFDGLFFGRLDYADKKKRMKTKTMEMVWKGSDSLGKSSWLFTGALLYGYGPPPGFCFDLLCNDEPIMDDPRLHDYNVDKKVAAFIQLAELQKVFYGTDHIIMTMGMDFHYQDAHVWYKNMDKLIRYVNEKQAVAKVNVFYSTPSCYLKALHDAGKSWTSKSDDFFPYASDPHAYWTGYFTSRPALKYMTRKTNNFLQVCKQLDVLSQLDSQEQTDITQLRESMAVAQHHDAVSGTEKQHVAYDYAERLSQGIHDCEKTVSKAYRKLMARDTAGVPVPNQQFCSLLNISQCNITENDHQFVVSVYNPLARQVSTYVRLPVRSQSYKVLDPKGQKVSCQVVPIPEPVLTIPGRSSSAKYELVFRATNLPPLGYFSYYITASSSKKLWLQQRSKLEKQQNLVEDVVIGNKYLKVAVDGNTGQMKNVTHGQSEVQVNQNFFWYNGMAGNNSEAKFRASGAYIFRPNGTTANPVTTKAKVAVYRGDLVEEVHQYFSDWVSQVIRVYEKENHIEMDWLIGPIPIEDKIGKEIVTRYSTNLDTWGKFYTDANGRQMMKRARDYRPTWDLNVTEPVSGNYYPINSRMLIEGKAEAWTKTQTFIVLTDRSQGGTSMTDGEIELMLHRRLLFDDAFGVGEALNEKAFGEGLVVRGKHYLVPVSNKAGESPAKLHRPLGEEIYMAPWVSLATTTLTFQDWSKNFRMQYAGMKTVLPPNVHLLTLEKWTEDSILLRLEHLFESGEDADMSKNVTVSLKDLFAPFTIFSAKETTLGANQWLKDSRRFEWTLETNDTMESNQVTPTPDESQSLNDDLVVTLQPMQIRTFVINMQFSNNL